METTFQPNKTQNTNKQFSWMQGKSIYKTNARDYNYKCLKLPATDRGKNALLSITKKLETDST